MRKKQEPGKIALISSIGATDWLSCRVITENLTKAYQKAFPKNAKVFSCENWNKPSDILKTAKRIYEFSPDRLIFLDHTPHPEVILRPLNLLYEPGKMPPIFIHVFGDFTRNTPEWLNLEELLRETRITFVCASHRQEELISRFLRKRDLVTTCPFPVDSKKYSWDPDLRKDWRTALGLKENDLLFFYSGRVSLQKQNILLAREFLKFSKSRRRSAQLIFAGSFDDLGAPQFGRTSQTGDSRKEWHRFLMDLPLKDRSLIRHLGNQSPTELKGLYNASDVFCSLSLYHDEDFGMAPAEALCCGLPAILSNWGGYTSFDLPDNPKAQLDCLLVPIGLRAKGLTMASRNIQTHFQNLTASAFSFGERERRAEKYHKAFSIEAVSKTLKRLHQSPMQNFAGFSTLLKRHSYALRHPPLFPKGPTKGGLYERVYGAYLGLR